MLFYTTKSESALWPVSMVKEGHQVNFLESSTDV